MLLLSPHPLWCYDHKLDVSLFLSLDENIKSQVTFADTCVVCLSNIKLHGKCIYLLQCA